MCRACIEGANFKLDAVVNPQPDFINCLLAGALAAMPYFLEAFLACMAGGGGGIGFTPGDRTRCDTPQPQTPPKA